METWISQVDLPFVTVYKVVVAGNVGTGIADVAESGPRWVIIIEDRLSVQITPLAAFNCIEISMAMPRCDG